MFTSLYIHTITLMTDHKSTVTQQTAYCNDIKRAARLHASIKATNREIPILPRNTETALSGAALSGVSLYMNSIFYVSIIINIQYR